MGRGKTSWLEATYRGLDNSSSYTKKVKLQKDTTRVIVGDVHGDVRGLRYLLQTIGAIDENDQRLPGFYLIQLGDLLHCGHGEMIRDRATAEFAEDLFDEQLAGNHELYHAYRLKTGEFQGMDKTVFPETQSILSKWSRENKMKAATSIDGWLISHAGLHSSFIGEMSSDPGKAAQEINNLFIRRISERTEVPQFDWIGAARSGQHAHGGIFWADFDELIADTANPYKQIVGHTPQKEVRKVGDKLWCVDVGAALSRRVPALVKNGEDGDWYPVVVFSPED